MTLSEQLFYCYDFVFGTKILQIMLKNITLIVVLAICWPLLTSAQNNKWEVGLFTGYSNYLGDLQQSQFEKDEMQFAYGVFARYNFNDFLAVKTQFLKGSITGADSNYETLLVSRERNLHFRSDIYELGVQGEFSFMKFGVKNTKLAAPYLLVGLSAFYFNPQAQLNEDWYDLQPLGTEGQGMKGHSELKKYSRVQVAIPIGVGFNIALGENTHLGFELGFRKTFTDYLDDVSGSYPDIEALEVENKMSAIFAYRSSEVTGEQMPNPMGKSRGSLKGNDMYAFGGVTLAFTLK